MKKLFLSILIVFFTISFMSIVGCNNQNIIEEQSSLSEKKINGYSELVESEPIVESPMVTPKISDSKIWEYLGDNWYYNENNITKSSNLLLVNPINGYSESVESEPIVESPTVTPKIPDSKIWEYFEDNWYYNKDNITKSSKIIKVWTYKIVTDDIRKKMIELRKKYSLKESTKYQHYDHYISLEIFDCKNKLRKREYSVDYDDEENVLDRGKYKKNEWKNIISESVMDKLYDKVCVTHKNPLNKK